MIDSLSAAYVEHLNTSPECRQAYDQGTGGRIALLATAEGYEYVCETCAARFPED